MLADVLVSDPELDSSLRTYERIRPAAGRIMRWHLDWTRAAFARLDLRRAEIILLHGDFAPWNLLFENDCLSGIVDFEASHLNYMVADFALSWRADQDDVLAGYADVQGPESFVRTISMRRNRGYSGARPIHGPHTAAYSARQGGASDRREGAERKAVADMPRQRRGECACNRQTHTRRHSDCFTRRSGSTRTE